MRQGLAKTWLALVAVWLCLASWPALAAGETPAIPETPSSREADANRLRPQLMTNAAGETGLWFSMSDAQWLALRLEHLDELVAAQQRLIESQETRAEHLRELADVARLGWESERKRAEEFKRTLAAEVDRGNSFWRSPQLWFGLGAIAATAISVGVAFAIGGGLAL